jgi:hypothetical protein
MMSAERRAPLKRDDQQALIEQHRATRALYDAAMDEHAGQLSIPIEIGIDSTSTAFVDTEAYRRARAALTTMASLEEEYFRRLPRMALSCCPLCEKPLYRAFDPFGVDGLWWRSDAQPDEPPSCPHFCVLLGAVDLTACRSKPDFDVHPGPGVPHVVPRLLQHPGMVAVVSQLAMEDGAKAYPLAYFAPRRPPVQELTASWARTNFVYTTQLGVHAWRRADEPPLGKSPDVWDFALERWLADDKLRWCEPGSDSSRLSAADPASCPFVGLTGVSRPQTVVATSR